jgi:hypothetical protein
MACQFEVRMEMSVPARSESLLLSPVIRAWN